MVGDTLSLLELLATRFGQPVAIVGFSLGATIGIQATARRPDLVAKVVAVGTDVDGVAAGISAYDFALSAARERRNARATHQLEQIGPPPHLDPHQFSTRVRWAYEFGGVTVNETYRASFRGLLASLLRSADYSIGDVVRTVRGIGTTQAALIGETAVLDLADTVRCIDVPIVMAQGRLDRVSPGSAAQRYFDALEAPSKELVWFDHSAHTPQLDEPEAFRSLLMRYLA
jgi:pimeloyl-ACP methyl ester carboxylesterase